MEKKELPKKVEPTKIIKKELEEKLLIEKKELEEKIKELKRNEIILKNNAKEEIEKVKEEMEGLKSNDIQYEREIDSLMETIINLEKDKTEKSIKLKEEKDNREIEKEERLFLKEKIKETSKKISSVNKANEQLNKDISTLNAETVEKDSIIKRQITLLEANKEKDSENFLNMENNLEFILREIDSDLIEYNKSYLIIELVLLSLSKKENLNRIEAELADKKMVSSLIENMNFKLIPINERKEQVIKLFENFNKYAEIMFHNQLKLNLSEEMPKVLILDLPKVNGVLYHLLKDMNKFSNTKEGLIVNVSYENNNKNLVIGLRTKLLKEEMDNGFKGMFKSKITETEKGRQELTIAKKLTEVLKGTIKIKTNEDNYEFLIKIPSKIINLSM